jgi:hypothetical protein
MLASLIASLLVLAVTVVVLSELLARPPPLERARPAPVPYEEWVKRIHRFVDQPPTLND